MKLPTLVLAFVVNIIGYNCYGQPQDTSSEVFTILEYGMPNWEKLNAERVVSKAWNIKLIGVAGCVVSQELVDSVERHNSVQYALIEEKYGKGWGKRYQNEIEKEFQLEKKVEVILKEISFLNKKEAELKEEGNGLHFKLDPIEGSSSFKIRAEGWGEWEDKTAWVCFYELEVDYEKNDYKLIADTVSFVHFETY